MNQTKIFTILIGALLPALPVRGQENVEQIITQKVQPILPENGKGGGVAVAVRMNGETHFFNYGFANDARNEHVTPDSIFNRGSVGETVCDNDPRFKLGLAWQNVSAGNFTIIDKNGGLPNTSTYIGFAPQCKLGVVILVNRGKQPATKIGRQILHALAQDQSQPSIEGQPDPDAN